MTSGAHRAIEIKVHIQSLIFSDTFLIRYLNRAITKAGVLQYTFLDSYFILLMN